MFDRRRDNRDDFVHDPVHEPLMDSRRLLIEVAAAGVNNTDVNTRIGWYSKSVRSGTSDGAEGFQSVGEDASWSGTPMRFPRIQGADVCGRIVGVGQDVSRATVGERVLVRAILRTYVDYRPFECWTLGSECDGGFAQYVVAPARETYAVQSEWSDAELAAVPCAYSTAEKMLHRPGVDAERVLVIDALVLCIVATRPRGAATGGLDRIWMTQGGVERAAPQPRPAPERLPAARQKVIRDSSTVAGPKMPSYACRR